jgi:hypothetical protein
MSIPSWPVNLARSVGQSVHYEGKQRRVLTWPADSWPDYPWSGRGPRRPLVPRQMLVAWQTALVEVPPQQVPVSLAIIAT